MSFFNVLIDYIEIVWTFFLNFINSISGLVIAIAGASIIPNALYTYMWGPIGSCVLAVTSFGVIKMLLGRSNL